MGNQKSPATLPLKSCICIVWNWMFTPLTERRKVYLKAGFKIEGVLRDAVRNGEEYADDILMSMLEEEWKAIKEKA